MGCDIHGHVELLTDGRWRRGVGLFPDNEIDDKDDPFDFMRDYGIFGFLADVRNHSHSPVIAEPRGLPPDVDMSDEERQNHADGGCHSTSWLTVAELLAYDYDQVFWDRRITKGNNGAALAEEGEGEHLTLREFLTEWYFGLLDRLAKLGDPEHVRIVFTFDN